MTIPQEVSPQAIQLVVGAAIVDSLQNPTHLLCAQRSYPEELRGKWELPGGKVDGQESPQAALRRELDEELGVKITVGQLVPAETATVDKQILAKWEKIYAHGGRYADILDQTPTLDGDENSPDWPLVANLRMRVWVCELASPPQPSSSNEALPPVFSKDGGHQELRWVKWDDLDKLDWLPADYPILNGIRHTIGI